MKRVVFCGHSLGGAVAQLAYFHFSTVEKLPFELECTTIGSPRVGCEHFSREFAFVSINRPFTRYGRFVNTDGNQNDDLVTFLPPFIYKHALNCQRITVEDNEVSVHDSCTSKLMPTRSILKTHDSEEYFGLIERYLSQRSSDDAFEEHDFNSNELMKIPKTGITSFHSFFEQ